MISRRRKRERESTNGRVEARKRREEGWRE